MRRTSFETIHQGGISIMNDGYAQIVSLFTICTDVEVFWEQVDNVISQTQTHHLAIFCC